MADTFAAQAFVTGDGVELIAGSGHRFRATLRRRNESHPFGPMVFDAPESLQVPGLRLSSRGLEAGSRIQVVVAAGEKTGVSTGTVACGRADRAARAA